MQRARSRTSTPLPDALKEARAALTLKGTSFSAFCAENGYVRQAVAAALTGQRNGKKSQALAAQFLAAVERLG